MSGHVTLNYTLTTDLTTGGSIAPNYPSGKTKSDFQLGRRHFIVAQQTIFYAPQDFEVSLGDSAATITWRHSATIPSGAQIRIQLDEGGNDSGDVARVTPFGDYFRVRNTARMQLVLIDLGNPDAADTDNMIKAATSAELPNAETVTYTPDTDGASPTDGVGPVVIRNGVKYWELDVPRNISVATSHASAIVAMTVKVTGLDEYGQEMYEEIVVDAGGTNATDAGKKAFKWVRSIAFTAAGNAEANTCNVGFGDVLGLPVFLPETALVLKELQDGAAASAGTLVAGSKVTASATGADVRGTYDPSAACDGSKGFQLIAALPDADYIGPEQYTA